MMNRFLIRVFIIVALATVLVSCGHSSKGNVDAFYTEKGEWDSGRIPLIKPYEAVITAKEFGWVVNLKGIDGDTGFQHVIKVTVKQGIIYLYSENSILHGVDLKQTWHVIIPAKHIEKGFSTLQEYLKYLNAIGIQTEPRLYDIELVAKYYDQHDVIDWNSIERY